MDDYTFNNPLTELIISANYICTLNTDFKLMAYKLTEGLSDEINYAQHKLIDI